MPRKSSFQSFSSDLFIRAKIGELGTQKKNKSETVLVLFTPLGQPNCHLSYPYKKKLIQLLMHVYLYDLYS